MNTLYEQQQTEAGENLAKSVREAKIKQLYANRADSRNPRMQGLRLESAALASDKVRDQLVEFMAVEANKRDLSYGFVLDTDLNSKCHALSKLVDEQVASGPENVEKRRDAMTRVFAHGNDDRNTYDDPDTVLDKLNKDKIFRFKAGKDDSGEIYVPADHQARELMEMIKDRVLHLNSVFANTERDNIQQYSGRKVLRNEILRLRGEDGASVAGLKRKFEKVQASDNSGDEPPAKKQRLEARPGPGAHMGASASAVGKSGFEAVDSLGVPGGKSPIQRLQSGTPPGPSVSSERGSASALVSQKPGYDTAEGRPGGEPKDDQKGRARGHSSEGEVRAGQLDSRRRDSMGRG